MDTAEHYSRDHTNPVRILFAVLLLCMFAAVASAGTEEGVTAFKNGEYEKAYKELRSTARNGDAEAQSRLASLYLNGFFVDQDYDKARIWFRKAYRSGSGETAAKAATGLGYIYENGYGVQLSQKKAIRFYKEAAEEGSPQAQTNLGLSYAQGKGVERNFGKAATWLRRAADQGMINAQSALSTMHLEGKGVRKSLDRALYWAEQAAKGGNAEDQSLYGVLLQRAGEERRAYKWRRKAALQAHPQSMLYIGNALLNGDVVEQDRLLGTAWLALAAKVDSEVAGQQYRQAKGKITDTEKKRMYELVQAIGDDPAAMAPSVHHGPGS